MALIEINNLSKNFGGVRSIDDLSVEIAKGAAIGIIGPNGSGKSTLINLISGMMAADSGTIVVNGKTVNDKKPWTIAQNGIVRTFQTTQLFGQMTVADNVMAVVSEKKVFASLFGKGKSYYAEMVRNILVRVGLLDKENQLAANLSYGQCRLLEMARVLASDAQIILLDEPFSGLHPETIRNVEEILRELKNRGKTIILIEHNIEMVRRLCDNVLILPDKRMAAASETRWES